MEIEFVRHPPLQGVVGIGGGAVRAHQLQVAPEVDPPVTDPLLLDARMRAGGAVGTGDFQVGRAG